MPPLPSDLRRLLETAVVNARNEAEHAATAALAALAVAQAEPFATMSTAQRRLRNGLRARARQLGGGQLSDGMPLLVEEIAYVQWHRMLFARFLAENDLLMHPDGVPVTLDECAELAPDEGEPDAWQLAARYAGLMLPGIFRPNDPTAQLRFAPEGRSALERIVVELPAPLFTADDALGWVYQFWQKQRKEAVNKSGRKIGGADIAPVTQLFTEPYMVQFLLENSLGAWWAARHPESPLLREMRYLRWVDDTDESSPAALTPLPPRADESSPAALTPLPPRADESSPVPPSSLPSPLVGEGSGVRGTTRPAAGSFPGWPARAAEVTMIDPCCGSGHFLVATFDLLRRMRMEEEGLSEAAAAEATLRDNIHGLELDPRCTQIAAFALAFAAWKAGGYRPLPTLNIACSGIPVEGQLTDWTALATHDDRLQRALERLYQLFKHAPDLGSLINPADLPANERMFSADYSEVEPLLAQALRNEQRDPAAEVFGAAAQGVARAARLLAGKYTLVATNVPYLGQKRQSELMKEFGRCHYIDTRADLATMFVERCKVFTQAHAGCSALVIPQYWFFLDSYKDMRERMLLEQTWNILGKLGSGAFETISGEVVNVGLLVLTACLSKASHQLFGIDAESAKSVCEKVWILSRGQLMSVDQQLLIKNFKSIVTLEPIGNISLLFQYVDVYYGSKPGQTTRVTRCFWEIPVITPNYWQLMESSPGHTGYYSGKSEICLSLEKIREYGISEFGIRGSQAWNQSGVITSKMNTLPSSIYCGQFFDDNTYVVVPKDSKYVHAVFLFMQSAEYKNEVRKRNSKLAIDTSSMINVPFDLARWQQVAEEAGPLPEPYSADPTQWLFNGRPAGAEAPLQVAVARLLGYRWPQQEEDGLDRLADADGIVCLPAVARELPAEERLRALLAQAYGAEWDAALQGRLLAAVGASELGSWLRDDFFKQHCALFHNRPFIWHVWDGRKDGFAALLNYHRLDAARLDKLIYTYLGGWIEAQRAAVERGEAGADGRLVAALALQKQLEAIKLGEPPYDIYVRWKPLQGQALGWNPDLNDGVRLNIRPFVLAGLLRAKFTINWNKDRGTNPDGSERLNDRHYTLAEKQQARGGS